MYVVKQKLMVLYMMLIWLELFNCNFLVRCIISYVYLFQVAAQNCRKRKLNLISHLQDEVDKYRQTKQSLLAERQELYRMRNEWTNKLYDLEDQVLRGLGKSPENFSLELMPHSQQIRIAQRHTSTSAPTTRRHLTKPTRAWYAFACHE